MLAHFGTECGTEFPVTRSIMLIHTSLFSSVGMPFSKSRTGGEQAEFILVIQDASIFTVCVDSVSQAPLNSPDHWFSVLLNLDSLDSLKSFW